MNGFGGLSLYIAIAIIGAFAVLLLAQWSARKDVEKRLTKQAFEDRQALERSKKQIVDILDNLPIGIIAVLGTSREVIFSNEMANELLMGRQPRNLELMHVDGRQVEHAENPFVKKAVPGEAFSACFIDSNKKRRYLTISCSIVQDDVTLEEEIIYMIMDDTLRIETSRALERGQRLESLGTLTRGVANDFSGLLQPILSSLDQVRKDSGLSSSSVEAVNEAFSSATKATGLVQRLLSFVADQDLQTRKVDLVNLVEGSYELFGRSLGKDVTSFFLPKANPTVSVDPSKLELAILNIVSNARDAMPEGGTLTITVEEDEFHHEENGLPAGHYARITFTDTGVGMTDDVRKKAVEPFFTTKDVKQASGLGLSMVHGLVEQSGGTLRLESTHGKGTRVDIWLPIASGLTEEIKGHAEPKPNRTAKILVVDDEDVMRAATSAMLREMGHNIEEASSGPEALTILRRDKSFEAVVSDHMMPGMTGLALANEIWDFNAQFPVLLLSGHAHMSTIPANVPKLIKPFRRNDLIIALNSILH
jgi:signal transduction histidine kinase